MARRLRIQYPGAIYHVINRGNYQRDLFDSVGAAQAFEKTLAETCEGHGWRIHAYVLMRNHFHLAVETPRSNLVEGMHWLQSTFAIRFNRFRSAHGHLFQGRYQAMLVEDAAALLRVVNYIHLNPVRAKIVPADQVAAFRWSSLPRFLRGLRPTWLDAGGWLGQAGFLDDAQGWKGYVRYLAERLRDPTDAAAESGALSRGWAIGGDGWRRAIAREHAHLALTTGIEREELREIKETRWAHLLAEALNAAGKNEEDLKLASKGAKWKIRIAIRLRGEAGAPYRWIADALCMGRPSSVRVYVCGGQKINM